MAGQEREARDLIAAQGLDLDPSLLVTAAEQLGAGLPETLALIMELRDGGQGAGPLPETKKALKGMKA